MRKSWKCDDSPTGAHHWVNITGSRWWICLYCGEDTDKFLLVWKNIPFNTARRKQQEEQFQEEAIGELISGGRIA